MFSITDTIRKSLKLAWKHKILWVFALLLASSFGSYNFYNQSRSSSDNKTINTVKEKNNLNGSVFENETFNTQQTKQPIISKENMDQSMQKGSRENMYNQMQNFKGTKSTVVTDNDSNLQYLEKIKAFRNQFSSLQDEFLNKLGGYILFVIIAFILFIILAIGLSLFLRSWAMGALIGGVDDILNNKPYTLFSLASWGRKSVRQLFKYNIYVAVLSFLIVVVGIVVPVIMLATKITSLEIIGGIVLFIAIIAILVFFLFISFGGVFATRFIVVNNENYKLAFKKGISTFKKNFGVTLKLAFANCAVSCVFMIIIGAVVIGLLGAVAVGFVPAIIAGVSNNPVLVIVFATLAVVVGIPLFIGFMVVMIGVKGFITTYTVFAYHKLYRFIMGIDKETANNSVDAFAPKSDSNPDNKLIKEGPDGE